MSAQPQLAAPTIAVAIDAARLAAKLTVGFPVGTVEASVWRVATVTGNAAFVRGWQERPTSVTTALIYDYEVPFGVELVYYAQSWDNLGSPSPLAQSAPLTVDGGDCWLVDLARPTNSFPIDVEALPELSFAGPIGVHRILDRRDPVLTTAAAWTPSGTLSFITATELERDQARAILGGGTAVLLRTPPEQGVGNLYLGVANLSEQRVSRLSLHPDRRFVVEVVQVARPDASLYVPGPPMTYRERLATWPKYADAKATGKSYQELVYVFPPGRIDPNPPWLPDDV